MHGAGQARGGLRQDREARCGFSPCHCGRLFKAQQALCRNTLSPPGGRASAPGHARPAFPKNAFASSADAWREDEKNRSALRVAGGRAPRASLLRRAGTSPVTRWCGSEPTQEGDQIALLLGGEGLRWAFMLWRMDGDLLLQPRRHPCLRERAVTREGVRPATSLGAWAAVFRSASSSPRRYRPACPQGRTHGHSMGIGEKCVPWSGAPGCSRFEAAPAPR